MDGKKDRKIELGPDGVLGLASFGHGDDLIMEGAGYMAEGTGELVLGAADLAGKVWNSPNTAIGLMIGLAGLPFGASIHFGNNAIQFWDYPWGSGGALTFGNSQIFNWPITAANGPNNIWWPRYDNIFDILLGIHEEEHTYQSQFLGPLFIPIYFLAGGVSASNPFEQDADDYSAAVGGTRPVTRQPYNEPSP